MKINQYQIDAIINLTSKERYLHFIASIVDWENVYMINCQDILHIFPAIEYTQLFAKAKKIDQKKIFKTSLEDFLTYILNNDIEINVFPTLLDNIYLINKEQLIEDIEEEIKKY